MVPRLTQGPPPLALAAHGLAQIRELAWRACRPERSGQTRSPWSRPQKVFRALLLEAAAAPPRRASFQPQRIAGFRRVWITARRAACLSGR